MRLVKAVAMGAAILATSLPTTASAQPTADLSVSLRGRPDPVVLNETITWTITVRNLGPAQATEASLEVFWGSDAIAVSATSTQGSCSPLAGVMTFSLGTIEPGGTVTATVVIQNFGGDGNTLGAGVMWSGRDPNDANNSARGSVRTIPGPPLGEVLRGTFCPPTGGVSTGGGGTAARSQPWLAAIGMVAMAGLVAAAVRRVRRSA
jgi:uncharacterized repeat protein (TIGR01451 family)